MQRLTRADQPATPWKNGGGSTRLLRVEPAEADIESFDWRVSVATIEVDGPFSRFPDVDRTLVLFSGERLELRVEGDARHLRLAGDTHTFAGELAVSARLHAGPVEALNIMVRRGRFAAEVSVVNDCVASGMLVGLDSESNANGVPLRIGDAAWGDDVALDGRAVLVRVRPAASA